MTFLVDSYLGASSPVVAPLYRGAGAPDVGRVDNLISAVYTITSSLNDAAAYSDLTVDAWTAAGQVIRGAGFQHTDEAQLLHGYALGFNNGRGSMKVEVGLYKANDSAFNATNQPTLVAGTNLLIDPIPVNAAGVPTIVFFPTPVALPVLPAGQKYFIARSSGLRNNTNPIEWRFRSFASAAGLRSSAGLADLDNHPLSATWPYATDISTEGPYWMRTLMAPANVNPMATLLASTGYQEAIYVSASGQTSFTFSVTLANNITGNRGVFIPLSVCGSAVSGITSITLGGVEGLVYQSDSQNANRNVGAIGFWNGSVGITSGVKSVVVTFSGTQGDIAADATVYEFDNINQDKTWHHYGHALGADGNSSTRSVPGTSRYFDGFYGTCRGGTFSTPYRINMTTGIYAGYLEFATNLTDSGNIKYSGLIPTTPEAWGLFYGLGNVSGRHVFPFFLTARA